MGRQKETVAQQVGEWVTPTKAANLLGLSRQAIYGRIKRREWRDGVEYRKRRNTLFINMPAIYAWIAQA